MAQVKLNLQPPPNVDFVTGYPGIPPGPDRPQSAVKGAIELRVSPQGVKAKWVRIELRKVETLPGSGPATTFYDFVGPSPVNLWSSSDEYSLLRSQDFPFSIRIPESIPPTVALDNRAGIGYELVASICTKGKRSFFLQKAKPVVISTIASIIIDKHDLHSTWPVYCQTETRHASHDGVNLSVQRNNTCYGPGDRISVTAVVKSDSLNTIILRTLELMLKETTVFHAGVLGPGRRIPPQKKQLSITESKLPVNVTLYGGSSHSAELSCLLSPSHTTTTLNAARHIDVTYTLCIKALLGTGAPLVMELPVIISNWQRNVSHQAISRIGPAPNLSLLPAGQGGPLPISTRIDTSRGRPADAVAATLPSNREIPGVRGQGYNSLPSHVSRPSEDGTAYGVSRIGSNGRADEFGSTRPPNAVTVTPLGVPPSNSSIITSSNSATARRPNSSGGGRFTVTNLQPQDIPQSTPTPAHQRSANATGSGQSSGTTQRQWPTAEEEKMRLYEKARAQVAKVQGPESTPPPAAVTSTPPRVLTPPQVFNSTPARVAASPPIKTAWMSAEEEKRLFHQAQAAVHKNQGLPYTAPPTHVRNDSGSSSKGQPSAGVSDKPSAAATLYAQAINAQGRSAVGPSSSASNTATPSRITPVVPQYLTAEQEKAALRRYEEAKRAVDRTQNFEESPSDLTVDQPPPFNSVPQPHLSEKERLRRAYEANDAAARARQNAYLPPPASPPTHGQYTNALEEKEALRKKFEERDNAQAKGALATQSPPRIGNGAAIDRISSPSGSPTVNATGSRPPPLPPAAASSRVLTAAEEKALLHAKFEAQDAQATRKPAINGNNASLPPSTPPPLMPRPPAEYIKETQEEDARVSRLTMDGVDDVPAFDFTPSNSRKETSIPHGTDPASPTMSDFCGINGKSLAGAAKDIKPSPSYGATFPGSPPLPTKHIGE